MGEGELGACREGLFEGPIFETKKLGFGTADKSFWRKPVEAFFNEVGAFGGVDEDDDDSGVETTEENLVQFDRDGVEDEDGVADLKAFLAEEVGASLHAGVEFAEGDGAVAVDDGNSFGIVCGEFFGEIHNSFAKRA